MKIFLTGCEQYDGEHCHWINTIVIAENEEEAIKIVDESIKLDEADCDTEESVWSWGDGTTATSFKSIQEIPTKDAEILKKYHVVNAELGR